MLGCSSQTVGLSIYNKRCWHTDCWHRYGKDVPADLPPSIVGQLRPYISTADISLLAHALNIVSLLLELAPESTFPEVESDLLKDIYNIAHSPLVAGAPFESVLEFFAALVRVDMQIATHVVPNLVISVDKAPKAEASQANIARCIGQVVKCQQTVAAGTIAEFGRHLKVSRVSFGRARSTRTDHS